jgi:hypothetical protein
MFSSGISPSTKRGIDIRLRYTQDDRQDTEVILRTTVDSEGNLLTPITDSLITRAIVKGAAPPIGNDRATRYIKITLLIPGNQSGIGEYKVVVPFHPSSQEFKQQIREIYSWVTNSLSVNPLLKKVVCAEYYGEDLDG